MFATLLKSLTKEINELNNLNSSNHAFKVTGLGNALPLFPALNLLENQSINLGIVVLESRTQANEAKEKLDFFVGPEKINTLIYPHLDEIPYEISPLDKNTTHQRLGVRALFKQLATPTQKPTLIITTPKALIEKIVAPHHLQTSIKIKVGNTIPPRQLAENLEELGYLREESVKQLGDYSLRGEILDIFSGGNSRPLRVYFFGDEIEEIRTFSLSSQTTVDKLAHVQIDHPSEWGYSKEKRKNLIKQLGEPSKSEKQTETTLFDKALASLKLHQSSSLSGILPSFDQEMVSLLDYLPTLAESNDTPKYSIYYQDYPKLVDSMEKELAQWKNIYQIKLAEDGINKASTNLRHHLTPPENVFLERFSKTNSELSTPSLPTNPTQKFLQEFFLSTWQHYSDKSTIDYGVTAPPSFKKKLTLASKYFAEKLTSGELERVYLFTPHLIRAKKLLQIFSDLKPIIITDDDPPNSKAEKGFFIVAKNLKNGFCYQKDMIICDYELFGKKPKQVFFQKESISEVIENFSDLREDDYIIHINHGIGIYRGLERIKLQNKEKDYLKIEYKNNSRLFVPVEQMNLVQKYIAAKGKVTLDQMGGKAWDKVKQRVKKNLENIAQQLIELYKKRRDYKVAPCQEDDFFQTEFEANFTFEETEDQLKVIREIKEDLQREYPMDRLLCADVGFGKTEVALRAVFKVILSGRQALFLAPTTILSLQHYQNILNRFEDFPVNIKVLNRFKTTKETNEILSDTQNGKVDLLIGTHKALSKKVQFKKLGLLVIDEEQKFGVKQKENLKAKYPHVDTLSLSATPIPRTLHMSLSSIRDISVMRTPPSNRLPIKTYVVELEDHIVKEAIERELVRNGQIFFVENRINHLGPIKKYLNRLYPHLKIAVVHGKLEGKELNEILNQFIDRKYDLLLSTSIIESGIDLHNVNTLLINNADLFGLTQLYQMKGRVGRGEQQGYAYFFTTRDKSISEDAMKRLAALSTYTELGAGFKIAMRDLEIRGPGNVIGQEQSGNVMAVGFELYTKLLNEAVEGAELRKKLAEEQERAMLLSNQEINQEQDKTSDSATLTIKATSNPPTQKKSDQHFFLGTFIELKYHGFIPSQYISNIEEKLGIYKKLASKDSLATIEKMKIRLREQYGKLPEEVEKLFKIANVRVMGNQIKIFSIKEKINLIEIELTEIEQISEKNLTDLVKNRKVSLSLNNPLIIHIKINNQEVLETLTPFSDKISMIKDFITAITPVTT